ncbi:PRKCA-binding protein isoform X2 [Trichogramma pretiosum]|uniref:PRKCA-binding protein isoform X2 n=1 Tax=Trichogramma pretiosum TaxID=7493 RepID=UPI0006C99C58|nr:PRKCA-binding protein isoform X2 [Trichogramma pretiosum]XP_023316176.1 PRKCA-binding protein isoform X2 [Trichogramma pretiosum]
MEYDEDFLFEEDKILTFDEISLMKSPCNKQQDINEIDIIDITDAESTMPLAGTDMFHSSMIEDRIPDIDLVAQDESPFFFQQDQMGMAITSGNVVIDKDNSNLIGISIGGGFPFCPCLYIVQVFDNTPAALDGTLEAGDELVAVNGECLKRKTKVEVAKMIQACGPKVSIIYNKLHADVQQGRSLDIILKKVKHRLVESMGNTTADALGLSRAILRNDTLVQRLAALEKTENLYKGLVAHAKSVLHAFFDLFQIYKIYGDAFASMGVKEPQHRASEAFTKFGEQHRQMEKIGIDMLKTIKPILSDLGTYLNKAIPDTRMTISRYADAKFEYLSYCLKVKEMDDEEQSYESIQEPLYRVETGNYEYRLILRCRQNARLKFAKLRSDVLVKLELLDNKHIEDVVVQLQKFATGLGDYYNNLSKLVSESIFFPVEIDLAQTTFLYKRPGEVTAYEDEEETEEARGFDPSKILDFDVAEEATPSNTNPENFTTDPNKKSSGVSDLSDLLDLSGFSDMNEKFEQLLQIEDQKKSDSEPLISMESEKVKASKDENDLFQPLLSLNDKQNNSLFLNKNNNAELNSPGDQKNTLDSLMFMDSQREESLIKIETN